MSKIIGKKCYYLYVIIAITAVFAIFGSNQLINSLSAAAAVIVGYSIDGRKNWKNDSGKTLAKLKLKKRNKITITNTEGFVASIG